MVNRKIGWGGIRHDKQAEVPLFWAPRFVNLTFIVPSFVLYLKISCYKTIFLTVSQKQG